MRSSPARRKPCHARSGARVALALLAAGLGAAAGAAPAPYDIDPAHLSIGFLTPHLGYAKTLGFFRMAKGSFVFDEESSTVTDINVFVDTDSVFTNHEQRDRHLRSGDFLNTRAFPQMVFSAGSARRTGEGTFLVEGQLSLLGVTRPFVLEATLNKSGQYPMDGNPYVIGVSAKGVLKRSAFGMSYGVDNGWVGDDVDVIIEFEARRRR